MPLLIILGIILIASIPKRKPRRNRPRRVKTYSAPHTLQPTVPAVIDPIKAQREQERQADRARKEAERQRKEAEQEAKRAEAKQAAQDEINWLHSYIDRLSALYEQIETELENPGLTEYKKIQLQKQLLQTEEKIHKNKVKLDKAYFTANN